MSGDPNQPVDRVEEAFQAFVEAAPLYQKLDGAKRMKSGNVKEKLAEHLEQGKITEEEMKTLLAVERARWDAIQVDEFTLDSVKKKSFSSVIGNYKNPID